MRVIYENKQIFFNELLSGIEAGKIKPKMISTSRDREFCFLIPEQVHRTTVSLILRGAFIVIGLAISFFLLFIPLIFRSLREKVDGFLSIKTSFMIHINPNTMKIVGAPAYLEKSIQETLDNLKQYSEEIQRHQREIILEAAKANAQLKALLKLPGR